ncbi:MAG TPA: hypothetical protein VHN20_14100 [Beijerinckiaceae bacterium]|nr:hypothetical protein [Beijerinckiaceae bacterium]
MLNTDPRGGFAADDAGVLLTIGGRFTNEPSGISMLGSSQDWQSRLFAQIDGSAPEPLVPALQEALDFPQAVFWSRILDGFVVSSQRGGPVIESRTSLLRRSGEVKALRPHGGVTLVEDLPRLGVAALLDAGFLAFVDRDGRVADVARLNSGDDPYGSHEVYETRDEGWLYVRGAQSDHAVHVGNADGAWRATRILRIVEEDGRFGGLVRTLVGLRDAQAGRGPPDIVRAGSCRRFSTVVQRMIFCDATDGVMREMRAGEIAAIEGRGTHLTEFIGDADGLGAALFRDWAGRVYAYDGMRLHAVAGAAIGARGVVQNVKHSRRTFISTSGAVFEIKGNAPDKLEIVQLEAPQGSASALIRFVDAADETFAFLRDGIYLVGRERLERRWVAREAIDVTGPTIPTEVPGWGGTLFATQAQDGSRRFHLLASCLLTSQ